MALVILVEASPRDHTGTIVAVRLAGGGSRPYSGCKGFKDWRSGVLGLPRYTTAIEFSDAGWTGGATPASAYVQFATSDAAFLATLCGYYWKGAHITVSSADDSAGVPAVWKVEMAGTVADFSLDTGVLKIVTTDLTGDLSKPIVPNTFAGTGGIEGGTDATGLVKRRSWGRCFNVEGFLLDKPNSIYQFGDPAQPLQSFDQVKDKGYAGVTPTVVAWAGSIAATFAALQAATAPQGGAAVAPSIACVKWWTTPVGPLTADIRGEVGAGYVEAPLDIAARIVGAISTISTAFTINATRAYPCGVHCDDPNETAAQVLDRLLLGVSLVWTLSTAGIVTINEFQWSTPVETLRSEGITRETVFMPVKDRKLGYQRNYRIHSASEVSSAFDDTSSGPNVINFSQFEGGSAGWLVTDPSAITGGHVIATPTSGKIAGKVTFTATAAAQTFTIAQDPALAFAVTAGTNLATMFQVEAIGPIQKVDALITYYDSTGAVLGTPFIFGTLNGTQVFGTPMRLHVLVPPLAVTATIGLKVTTIAAGAGSASIIEPSVAVTPQGSISYPVFTAGPNAADGADVTALNQIAVTNALTVDIAADYTGTIQTGVLPRIVTPLVTKSGVNITTTDNLLSYSISNDTGGCAGNVTVDNTNGASTKGQQTISTSFNATGQYQLNVTYNGVLVDTIIVKVTKVVAAAPGGGGGGSTTTFDATGVTLTLTSFNQIAVLTSLTLPSGKSFHGNFNGSYEYNGVAGARVVNAKYQYSPAGANTWTDFGSAVAGSSALANNATVGSVSVAQVASPAAASYDIRLVGSLNANTTGFYSVSFDSGPGSVTIS